MSTRSNNSHFYPNKVTSGITNAGGQYTSPDGNTIYIWAVMNSDDSARSIGFDTNVDPGLGGDLIIPKESTLALTVPIKCHKMHISHANLTVIWRDEA
jgi:hypothetical protein